MRQTLTYIRGVMESRGLHPRHKLGQNFLIDLNLLDILIQGADLSPTDSVLEVGTGTGSLSERISESAGHLLTVDIDIYLQRMARDILGPHDNITFAQGDILESKNKLNQEILKKWDDATASHGLTKRKIVANLPYSVATPVIANALIAGIDIERMVVMVQWEMAQRMAAPASTKDYSSLSVLVQSLADVEILRQLPPSAFWPRPEVDSGIVRITPRAEKIARIASVPRYRAFLRDLYTHRRKNLRQALSGWPTGHKEKSEVDAVLAGIGIDGTLRAEALDIPTHIRLWQAFDPIMDAKIED